MVGRPSRDTRSQTLDQNSTYRVPNSQALPEDDDEQLQREVRAHKRRMMQLEAAEAEARIENLRHQASNVSSNRSQVHYDTGAGEDYTPVITSISNEMPGIAPRDVYLISEHKFDPSNLSRLHAPSATAAISTSLPFEEPHSYIEMDPTSRQIMMKRPRGSPKDFGNTPEIWLASFTNYIRIIALLFINDHPGAIIGMLHFQRRVQDLAQTYAWDAVLGFALDTHKLIASTSILSRDAWENVNRSRLDHWINTSTVRAKKVKMSPTSKSSETCNNFNNAKGCKFRGCTRRHECTKCQSPAHGAESCKL